HYLQSKNNNLDKFSDQDQKNRSSSPSSLPDTSSTLFTTVTWINGQNYIICHALGHLYGLSDSNKGLRRAFPVLDPSWLPLSITKGKGSSKFLTFKIEKIIREISQISKSATDFIHACDYDQEGE